MTSGTRIGRGTGHVAALGAIAVAGLAGCAGQADEPAGEVVAVATRPGAHPGHGKDALNRGELMVENGCLVLGKDGVASAVAVVYAEGTQMRVVDGTIRIQGETYELGVTKDYGGGTHALDDPVDVPQECAELDLPLTDLGG